MQITLSPKQKTATTLLICALLSLSCSLLSIIFLREVMLPFAAAALAALFVLESERRRVFSAVISLLIIAADVQLCGLATYISVEIVAIALIIACFFLRGSKAECSFWITLTFALFVLLTMVYASYAATKTLTLDSFLDYYIDLYRGIEEQFIESFDEYSAALGVPADKANAAMASRLLSSMASVIPSVILLAGFAVSGIALKIFSGILRLLCDADSNERISSWRFSLPKAMYVAFWIVLALNLILGIAGLEGVLPVVITNVYNVLLFIFAYIGFGVVVSLLTNAFKRRNTAILVTICSIAFLGALAVELISYFGASFIFRGGRNAENK